ncbi:MAG: hypothetical protein J7M21_05905, partial [Planctomycetes bacterium]|nr:hypothetical protein [Planctomycetota bacterium]
MRSVGLAAMGLAAASLALAASAARGAGPTRASVGSKQPAGSKQSAKGISWDGPKEERWLGDLVAEELRRANGAEQFDA